MLEFIFVAVFTFFLYDYVKDICLDIPGPKNWLGILNSYEFTTNMDTILDYLMTNFQKNTNWTLKLIGFPRYVFTNNVKNMQYVLKENFYNYEKGPLVRKNFHDLLGDGIFTVDGESWKVQRQAAAKIFYVNNFRDNMTLVFNRHLETVCSILNQPRTIDFHNLMHKFTLDSFTEIGYGESVGSLNSKNNEFAVAFDGLQQLVNESFIVPPFLVFFKDLLLNRLSLRKHYKSIIDGFSYKVIQRRLQLTELKKDDLLSHFLRMKKENGETYKPLDLRNIVMNFIIAGRDTTAQALSWAVYELRNRPDIIDKIRSEAAEKIKDLHHVTYEEIKSLTYTTAVFMECLRLHPSVPKNVKFAVKNDVLPDGTKIRAGWGVVWSAYCQARSKHIWGEDCLLLRPERFLDDNYDPNINFSFHHGPRTCLGQNMAVLEAALALVTIYSKFDINVLTRNVTYNSTVTLQMKGPLMIEATARQ
eukprot:NODE_417_length_8973_cov_0.852941.p1 type:complete len:474 gc:universal NODE_417_length_8973_cov_0.852941:8676-7255(-)